MEFHTKLRRSILAEDLSPLWFIIYQSQTLILMLRRQGAAIIEYAGCLVCVRICVWMLKIKGSFQKERAIMCHYFG